MRVVIQGAAPDTGNLGVSALLRSTLTGIATRVPSFSATVFDYKRGVRKAVMRLHDRELNYWRSGAVWSRRVYRRESLWNVWVSGWFGGLGNAAAKAIGSADAVLDASGGDSFTDLYGMKRFWSVAVPKLIALERGVPLILLPQTIGPFARTRARRTARYILRRSTAIWTRDDASYQALRDLLGADFKPSQCRRGVDLAFGLDAVQPKASVPSPVISWLAGNPSQPTVGLNVSGMLYNDAARMARRYGLKADYRKAVTLVLRRFLDRTNANVLLIPHVLSPVGHYESDPGAFQDMVRSVGRSADDRIEILPPSFDESETKWIISKTNWFCGSRMHSSIAALSSGVPAAGMAYSVKTSGVFESCGQGEYVADLRSLDTEKIVDHVWQSWLAREDAKRSLDVHLIRIREQTEQQMDAIVDCCRGSWDGVDALGASASTGIRRDVEQVRGECPKCA